MSSELREIWTDAGGRAPAHWSFVRFEDLLAGPKSIAVGVMYPGSHDESGVPLIKVSDVKNGAVVAEPAFRISELVNHEYRRTSLCGNELLITLVGNPGDCAIVDDSMAGWNAARALAVVRLKDPTIRPWLRYVLLSSTAKHLIDARLNTTVQKTLNLKDIRSLPIPIAPQVERNTIVETAAALEHKINVNLQINQTLEQMAQAVFKSWFVDFEPVKAKIAALEAGGSEEDVLLAAMQAISGKGEAALTRLQAEQPEQYTELRTTAELFPAAMQDSELGEIPEGWGVNQIGDLVTRIPVGKKYSQKTASETGDVPVLDQGKSGIIGYHNEKPGVTACPDDPVIVFANHTCYMRLIMHDFSAIQNVLPFKSKPAKALNIFWLYFATHGKQEFIEYKGHWPDFVVKEIVVPDDSIASRFGSIAKDLVVNQFRNEKQNETLSAIRDAMLPKLLSGELSVTDVANQTEGAEGAEGAVNV